MEEYYLERLSESNIGKLVDLYWDCFKIKVDKAHLLLKYDTQSFGASFIGYLAFKNETSEVAGYYGVFPMVGIYEGKQYLIAQSGDTMTHSKHRGKGLFTSLAKKTYELAKNEGVNFVFGFPNKNSYPGFVKKLDWTHEDNMNHYIIRTGRIPLDKLAKKSKLVAFFYKKYVAFKLKSIRMANDFIDNQDSQTVGQIYHDSAFFNYKKYHQSYAIELNGIQSVVKIDGRLWVGKIVVSDENEAKKAIDGLIILAKKLGCSAVQFTVFNNNMLDQILANKYKLSSELPVGYLDLSGKLKPSNFEFDAVDFDTF